MVSSEFFRFIIKSSMHATFWIADAHIRLYLRNYFSYMKFINLINKRLLSTCLIPDTMLSTGPAKGSKVESLLLWSFKRSGFLS